MTSLLSPLRVVLILCALILAAPVTESRAAGLIKVPQFAEALRINPGALIMVVTNSTATNTSFIYASNLLHSLTNFNEWTGGGGGGSVDPTNAVLANIIETGAVTNQNALILHSNAVKYATARGLTNREAISDISGAFWALQNKGLLPALHDAAFLRGGQNAETNIAVRFTYRGSNGTSYGSPVQTAKGILTGSGGGGYNFPTDDLSTNFTLVFSGQTGAGGQTAYSHMISYTHATGSTNFGISIGHDVNNANVVVRSNNTTAVYAANYFGHLFTDYLRDDYPFPFTAGFGYQRSGLLTNFHNGYISTNSSGNHPLSGLTVITVGSRLDDASPGYAQSWTGTAHAWLLFNRQLSSNEIADVELVLRELAPTTHNEIAVGDSTSANIYTKQAESWSYQWFTGPGTNLGEYYIAAASGRSAVSMNSLWDDTVSRRKPQGKVKTATARIWAGINDIYAGGTGQAVWETVSNMTVKATRDGVGVEIATLYPSVAYDASMRVQWTNYNNQILSNANMFKKVYRRDLLFAKTNGVMWYDFLHLSTNGLGLVVQDMAQGGALGWKSQTPYYPLLTSQSVVVIGTDGYPTNATLSGASVSGSALTISAQTNASIVRQLELTASSNAAVAFSMTVSNTLYGTETTRNAAVSNAVVAFAMTVSNAVYTTETTRNAAVSNAAVAFTMTASNTLYSLIGSGGNTGTSNSIPVVTITTNVNIGFGTMQSLAMTTPSNQFVNFQGTETNGDTVELAVTNSAATNITITFNLDGTTSSYYDPTAGTNRSSFVVSPGGKILTFVYSTNWGAIWRLNAYIGRELELTTAKGFGVGLLSSTNGDTVTLTATRTNAITYAATNTTSLHIDWTGTEHVIVPNLLETNLVLIPTNMIVGREIYLTFLPGSVSYNISISNAAGTRVRWNLATNSGNAALTKTNTIQVEASLLYQTNGISAAVGRFIY